jgi:hypothetical protein
MTRESAEMQKASLDALEDSALVLTVAKLP